MGQHALGRLDAQPLEQFGITQRQFDHLAQLVDGRGHAADIVIGDIGAPGFARFLIFGAQLDLGIFIDMDHTLGAGRHDREADFLQCIGRRVHELRDARRHVGDALLPGGRHHVALTERTIEEGPLQRLRRTLEPQILLGGCEHHASRRFRFDAPHLDEIARADPGIGPLQPVDTQQVEAFIFRIGRDGARRGRLFADDLDDIALGNAQCRHQRARKMGQAAPGILGAAVRHLYLAGRRVAVGHDRPLPSI